MTQDAINIAMLMLGTFYWIDFFMGLTRFGTALGRYAHHVPVDQVIELLVNKLPSLTSSYTPYQLRLVGRLTLIACAVIPVLPWLLLVLLSVELRQWYLLYLVLPKLLDTGRRLFWI